LRVLLTGATGFVGSVVLRRVVDEDNYDVRAAVRGTSSAIRAGIDRVLVGDADATTDWRPALAGVSRGARRSDFARPNNSATSSSKSCWMNPWMCVCAKVSSVSHSGLDAASPAIIFCIGRSLLFVAGNSSRG
jgi:hypothetical protein